VTSYPAKLTENNQGYWDRIKRARSWVTRARAVESVTVDNADAQELFTMY
jgi:hypothetical protein